MGYVRVGKLSELPPGEVMEARVGDRPYAVCNVDGELYAVEGICPHRQGPLGQGALHGHMLVCPWHAWEFDCRTGRNDRSPEVGVATVPVKVEDGEILIDAG